MPHENLKHWILVFKFLAYVTLIEPFTATDFNIGKSPLIERPPD